LGDLSPGVKWLGHEVHQSTPSTAEVKNEWSYISTPPYTFMAWTALTLTVLYLHSIHFTHKLYSGMAGFLILPPRLSLWVSFY
jgi:hypothetical protein